MKLKVWICDQKKKGFHLISKNILLMVEPGGGGGENMIGIRAFKLLYPIISYNTVVSRVV